MPSRKPRLALTLPVELRDALLELSEVLGKSLATVTVELLVEILPQITAVAKLQRAVRTGNKATAKRALVEMVGKEMADVMTAHQKELFKARQAHK
jgi:predicted flavoprotein YhiN